MFSQSHERTSYYDSWPYLQSSYEIHDQILYIRSDLLFNSSLPSAAYMCQCTRSALGQKMAWRQAIIWTNAGILLIGPLGTNFCEVLIKIYIFWLKKGIWKCVQNGSHFVQGEMS